MDNLAVIFQQLADTIAANGVQQNLAFQPSPFKGSPTEDIDDFLTKFRNFCDYNNQNDAAKLQISPSYYTAKLSRFTMPLTIPPNTISTY